MFLQVLLEQIDVIGQRSRSLAFLALQGLQFIPGAISLDLSSQQRRTFASFRTTDTLFQIIDHLHRRTMVTSSDRSFLTDFLSFKTNPIRMQNDAKPKKWTKRSFEFHWTPGQFDPRLVRSSLIFVLADGNAWRLSERLPKQVFVATFLTSRRAEENYDRFKKSIE